MSTWAKHEPSRSDALTHTSSTSRETHYSAHGQDLFEIATYKHAQLIAIFVYHYFPVLTISL